MSNRRNGGATAKVRAPRDPAATADSVPERAPRSWVSLLLQGAKVLVGLVLIATAVGGLAFSVYRYAQTTPRFAISRIELEGTSRLAREDVLLAAGIERGDNLFALDIEQAERSLLESPWIATARVTRRLPGTVRLEVMERQAIAVTLLGGKSYLVSQDGEPFKTLGSGDPHDLPLITGLSPSALADDRGAELERLRDSLLLIRDYERLSVAKNYPVQEIHLTPSGGSVMMVGSSGVALHLGTAPWKQKLMRAERVLSRTTRAGGNPSVVFLDNDAHPERVVVRVR